MKCHRLLDLSEPSDYPYQSLVPRRRVPYSYHVMFIYHQTLSQDHRIAILIVMERIVVEMIDYIEEDISKDLIKQAASEMISSKVGQRLRGQRSEVAGPHFN